MALGLMLLGALCLRAWATLRFPNVVWPDEIHQTLEQAHRLAFGRGFVPWEFRDGARSWLLPGALAGIMRITPGDGTAPLRAVQLLLCALALAPVAVAQVIAARARGVVAGLVAGGLAATWFELILFSPKALNEVVAAHLLLAGLHLEAACAHRRRWGLLAGALLGGAVVLRMHLLPATLLGLACSARGDRRRWSLLLPGVASVVALAGLVDLFTWGLPFRSFVTALRFNVLEGRSAEFGVAPWSAYLEVLASTWSWSALALVPLAILGARRRPSFAVAALALLGTHAAFAHKEYRFIYPAVLLAIVLASLGAGEVWGWLADRVAASGRALAAAALLLCAGGMSLWRALEYQTTPIDPLDATATPRWTHEAWGLESMTAAGARPDLCGLGLVAVSWIWTGGYTYLHRDVPIFLIVDEQDGAATAGGYNSVIAPATLIPNLTGFTVRRCWPGGECLAERPGGCRPIPGDQINERLRSWGA